MSNANTFGTPDSIVIRRPSDMKPSRLSERGRGLVIGRLNEHPQRAIIHVESWLLDEKNLVSFGKATTLVEVHVEYETDAAYLVTQPESYGEARAGAGDDDGEWLPKGQLTLFKRPENAEGDIGIGTTTFSDFAGADGGSSKEQVGEAGSGGR